MSVKFPDVPFAVGVPPVFRRALTDARTELNAATTAIQNKLVADAISRQGTPPAIWAIYDSTGNEALFPDNWISFEPMSESSVADYPMQPGAFESYNKVQTPTELRVTVTKGGSDSDREDFLREVDRYRRDTDLLDIVVPDFSFIGYTLTHFDYSRKSDRGVTLLSVDLTFREIRQTATAAFSNSKEPSGTDTVNDGPVRAAPVDDSAVGPVQ